MLYSNVIFQCYITMSYSNVILQCHIPMSYFNAILQCYIQLSCHWSDDPRPVCQLCCTGSQTFYLTFYRIKFFSQTDFSRISSKCHVSENDRHWWGGRVGNSNEQDQVKIWPTMKKSNFDSVFIFVERASLGGLHFKGIFLSKLIQVEEHTLGKRHWNMSQKMHWEILCNLQTHRL